MSKYNLGLAEHRHRVPKNVWNMILGRSGAETEEQQKLSEHIISLQQSINILKRRLIDMCSHPIEYLEYRYDSITDTLGNKIKSAWEEVNCLRCGERIIYIED
jgi:hypothetical protein